MPKSLLPPEVIIVRVGVPEMVSSAPAVSNTVSPTIKTLSASFSTRVMVGAVLSIVKVILVVPA